MPQLIGDGASCEDSDFEYTHLNILYVANCREFFDVYTSYIGNCDYLGNAEEVCCDCGNIVPTWKYGFVWQSNISQFADVTIYDYRGYPVPSNVVGYGSLLQCSFSPKRANVPIFISKSAFRIFQNEVILDFIAFMMCSFVAFVHFIFRTTHPSLIFCSTIYRLQTGSNMTAPSLFWLQ